MNIMQIISGWGVNGAARHCLLLTRELVRRGNNVTLVCRPGAWIARQLASERLEIVFSDLHRWPTDELRRIGRLLQQRQTEVVHTHMSRAHFFGVLLRWMSNTPCVATAHNCHFQPYWMFNDLVIAVSDATRRYHETYNMVRSDRIVTIHNFIDYRRIAAVPDQTRAEVRQSLGIEDGVPLIGVVGSVIPRKGQIYLVRALPKILAAVPKTTLMVVGETEQTDYVSQVKSTATDLGVTENIVWTGQRDDIPDIMAAMDVLVLPSLVESLGMVLLEAMAAGVPTVGTTVGGIPECIVPDETGLLVAPRDRDALGDGVIRLLLAPAFCRRLGEAGRRRVREHFSTDTQATSIEAAFAQVTRRRRAA